MLTRRYSFSLAQNLILVPNANDKFYFINKLRENLYCVEFYDDLSYNHENGEIKFYDDLIDKINKLGIKYYDFYFLSNLQNVDYVAY